MKILLVVADQTLQNQLHQDLYRHSFTVDVASDGEQAWELLQVFFYDFVLIEAVIPRLDGVSLCRRLRNVGNPVLVLLILEAAQQKTCVPGLDSGADACLTKPIQEPELLAHLRALSRRGVHRASLSLTWGPLSINPVAQQITGHGQMLKLNRKQYQILELFLNQPRKMFSRREIGDRLWALEEPLPSEATIKSHIRSIRRILEQAEVEDFIQTHYGQGYCLNPTYGPDLSVEDKFSVAPGSVLNTITAHLWQELMAANARLHQEIEQRQQIESQLRRSEEMLRNAQRVAQIGCWEFYPETRQSYWTEELFLIHGLDPKSPVPTAEQVFSLIHPDDLPIHQKEIREPALRREPFEANLRIIRVNDGAVRHINARGGPIFDDDGNLIKLIGTTFDITEWLAKNSQSFAKPSPIAAKHGLI